MRRFYKFWGTFETWRDPLADALQCGEELCDLAEAENREERRCAPRSGALWVLSGHFGAFFVTVLFIFS